MRKIKAPSPASATTTVSHKMMNIDSDLPQQKRSPHRSFGGEHGNFWSTNLDAIVGRTDTSAK